MTKEHFEEIAKIINRNIDYRNEFPEAIHIARDLATYFFNINSRFDYNKFMKKCICDLNKKC